MADFTSVSSISSNMMRSAEDILRHFKNIYGECVAVAEILARYNTDAAFKSEADHLFNQDQLAELGNMIGDVNTLKTHWEVNHTGPLNL